MAVGTRWNPSEETIWEIVAKIDSIRLQIQEFRQLNQQVNKHPGQIEELCKSSDPKLEQLVVAASAPLPNVEAPIAPDQGRDQNQSNDDSLEVQASTPIDSQQVQASSQQQLQDSHSKFEGHQAPIEFLNESSVDSFKMSQMAEDMKKLREESEASEQVTDSFEDSVEMLQEDVILAQDSELESPENSGEYDHGILEAPPTKLNWEIIPEATNLSFSIDYGLKGNTPSLKLERSVFADCNVVKRHERHYRNCGNFDAQQVFEDMPLSKFSGSDCYAHVSSAQLQLGNRVFDPGDTDSECYGADEDPKELQELGTFGSNVQEAQDKNTIEDNKISELASEDVSKYSLGMEKFDANIIVVEELKSDNALVVLMEIESELLITMSSQEVPNTLVDEEVEEPRLGDGELRACTSAYKSKLSENSQFASLRRALEPCYQCWATYLATHECKNQSPISLVTTEIHKVQYTGCSKLPQLDDKSLASLAVVVSSIANDEVGEWLEETISSGGSSAQLLIIHGNLNFDPVGIKTEGCKLYGYVLGHVLRLSRCDGSFDILMTDGWNIQASEQIISCQIEEMPKFVADSCTLMADDMFLVFDPGGVFTLYATGLALISNRGYEFVESPYETVLIGSCQKLNGLIFVYDPGGVLVWFADRFLGLLLLTGIVILMLKVESLLSHQPHMKQQLLRGFTEVGKITKYILSWRQSLEFWCSFEVLKWKIVDKRMLVQWATLTSDVFVDSTIDNLVVGPSCMGMAIANSPPDSVVWEFIVLIAMTSFPYDRGKEDTLRSTRVDSNIIKDESWVLETD